ncbi:hypothetical protein GCM10010112_61370 [Actinoplanes lobatus]|uniref:Uncharacterized protein n=1 Tax=Actinoplanes lobatus TaxID=113568 RepID=A0A7W7H8X6_9ACTN|nr:hypothetical protein [Actinoplanes lobatus]MBB4745992.1 hypothetical protein [Actinoplanes lobatus]GGN83239.1 hypothetical protein GCM10010112_61370 [Actinoplanes lobatus]GIE42327.1 hypothetical protein Alo02nite_52250 [Actinoplanes lobatus]
MRKAMIGVGAAVLALGGSLAVAVPASAHTEYGDYRGTDVRIRNTPYTTDNVIHGLGQPGHGTAQYCFKIGSTVSGNRYWQYHMNRRTSVKGYSSETLLTVVNGEMC